jgi:hypothetical protein
MSWEMVLIFVICAVAFLLIEAWLIQLENRAQRTSIPALLTSCLYNSASFVLLTLWFDCQSH